MSDEYKSLEPQKAPPSAAPVTAKQVDDCFNLLQQILEEQKKTNESLDQCVDYLSIISNCDLEEIKNAIKYGKGHD